jgi:hypothetical protein
MKLYREEFIKRHLQFLILIILAVLNLLALIINFKVLVSDRKPTLIAIDQNGTRIISESQDPIFKTEATTFLSKFLMQTYNFNSETFMKRVGAATALMSEDLWKEKKNSVLDLKNKVERDEISLTSQIQKITKDESGNYFAEIIAEEKSRMQTKSHQIQVKLSLTSVPRSSENPAGLEVKSYEELNARP